MKKLISLVLAVTIILGTFIFSVPATAATTPVLSVESVEKTQGTGNYVSPRITISQNPGIYSLKLIVYYDKTQLAKSEVEAFDGSIFGTDSAVGSERAGTHRDIRSYIPSELQGYSKGFVVDLCGTYDEELGDTAIVTENGLAVSLPLSIVAEDFGEFEFNVVVAEAYDAEGNEIYIDDMTATVAYVPDPYIGIYDEFTVFATPEEKDIILGTDKVSVDIRFDQNPGLWSTRIFVVYPETIKLNSKNNVVNSFEVYKDAGDMIVGTPDLPLDDPRQTQGLKDILAADPSIVKEGYVSTTIYFEPENFRNINYGNGSLCTLNFTVSDEVAAGDVLDIKIYYGKTDFLYASTLPNGTPTFVSYNPVVHGAELTFVEVHCDHLSTYTQVVNPTCTESGMINTVCNDCQRIIATVEIPAAGHSYLQPGGTIVYSPSCTEDGYAEQHCDHCDHVEIIPGKPAWGHDEDGKVVIVDATCETAGEKIIYCSFCEEVSKVETIPATGHSYSYTVVPPTCEEEGYTIKRCDVCGESEIENRVPVQEHNMNGETIEDPTCTAPGKRIVFCTACGEVVMTEEIPALGHNGEIEVVTVNPTCVSSGVKTIYCSVCGEEVSMEEIPALGHDENGYVWIVDPTCQSEGSKTIYCSVCGKISKIESIPLQEHVYESGTCVNCGVVFSLEVENVTTFDGLGAQVSPAVSIINNPGAYYIKLVVYYEAEQFIRTADISSAFENSVFSAVDSSISTEYAGTNNKVKNYIPEELRLTSRAFIVELCGEYDEGIYDTKIVTEDGIAVNLPLTVRTAEEGEYSYTVVVAEAYDKNGEELVVDDAVGTVESIEDPYIDIYDDFTVFVTPPAEDIKAGSKEISVDIRFDKNPGLWSTRLYIVYPEALTLGSADNVVNSFAIYPGEADLFVGMPDLALNDYRQVQGFKDVMAANPSIVKEGYHSTTIYFEPAAFDKVNSGDGILCTLKFTVADDVEIGDVLDIMLYYGEADFLWAGTDENGMPEFVEYSPNVYGAELTIVDELCDHLSTYVKTEAPTCTVNGANKTVCHDCGRTIETVEIPATGHSPVTDVVDPTCVSDGERVTYCSVCTEIISEEIIPALGHDADGEVFTVPPTCTVPGERITHCSVCGEIVLAETIPATGHSDEHKIITVEPTCTDFGYKIEACTVCGEVESVVVIAANGHTYVDTVVNPTMLAEGYTEHTCSECGHSYRDSYVDAIEGEIAAGDINGDGNINGMDINVIIRIITGIIVPTDEQRAACDVNGDGKLNSMDGNALSREVSGI